MENIWDWHKSGKQSENIDLFIENLKVANKHEGLLFSHQSLRSGDINVSSVQLMSVLIENPKLIDKVLDAAIEMHRFCCRNCKRGKDVALDTEMLALPAMLDALSENGFKNSKSVYLMGKANMIIHNEKKNLRENQNPMMRTIYDRYKESFKPMLEANKKVGTSNTRGNPGVMREI